MDFVYQVPLPSINAYLFNYLKTWSRPHNLCADEDQPLLDLVKQYVNEDKNTLNAIKKEFYKKIERELNRIKEFRNA